MHNKSLALLRFFWKGTILTFYSLCATIYLSVIGKGKNHDRKKTKRKEVSFIREKQTIAANTDGEGNNAKNQIPKPPYDPEKDELLTYGRTHPKRIALMWLLSSISATLFSQKNNRESGSEKDE